MAKSYFAILGISPDATGEEVKSAFRKLAKEFHPDHYAGGNERFRQIQEAYAVLADRRKRREYEQSIRQTRPAAGRKPEPLIPRRGAAAQTGLSPSRFFRSCTGAFDELLSRTRHSASPYSGSESAYFKNPTIEIALTAAQSRRGGTARILVPVQAVCSACNGYGATPWHICTRCGGRGKVAAEIPLAVVFPPGLIHDYAIAIPLDQYGLPNTLVTVVFRPLLHRVD